MTNIGDEVPKLPAKMIKAIIDRLNYELSITPVRQSSGGFTIEIGISPDLTEYTIELSSRLAKVKVR